MADDIVTRLNYFWQSDLYCDPEFTIQLCDEAAAEIERLRQWKTEAISVIENWEAAWEAAGKPGVLGQSKSLGLLGELGRLQDEIERLRSLGDRVWMHADAPYGSGNPAPDWVKKDLDAWKEARRGLA